MLNSISWQQYVTALLLLTAAWYAWVGLSYYRAELTQFLRIRAAAPPVAAAPLKAVMGSIQPDTGTELRGAGELIFGPAEPDDISAATLPPGPQEELLAEAEILVSAFAEAGSKADFLSLLHLLIGRYEPDREAISPEQLAVRLQQITARLPFRLDELELRWPAENA